MHIHTCLEISSIIGCSGLMNTFEHVLLLRKTTVLPCGVNFIVFDWFAGCLLNFLCLFVYLLAFISACFGVVGQACILHTHTHIYIHIHIYHDDNQRVSEVHHCTVAQKH
jgi:hypothetical protein